jgi:hypothetical protein
VKHVISPRLPRELELIIRVATTNLPLKELKMKLISKVVAAAFAGAMVAAAIAQAAPMLHKVIS